PLTFTEGDQRVDTHRQQGRGHLSRCRRGIGKLLMERPDNEPRRAGVRDEDAHPLRCAGSPLKVCLPKFVHVCITLVRSPTMLRTLLKSKIHRATVTACDLNYVGSLTV